MSILANFLLDVLPADNSVFGAGNGSGRVNQFFEVVAGLARVQDFLRLMALGNLMPPLSGLN